MTTSHQSGGCDDGSDTVEAIGLVAKCKDGYSAGSHCSWGRKTLVNPGSWQGGFGDFEKTPKCYIWDTSAWSWSCLSVRTCQCVTLSTCIVVCGSGYMYTGLLKGLRRWWICQSCSRSACPLIGSDAVCIHDVSNASVFHIHAASMSCWVWV